MQHIITVKNIKCDGCVTAINEGVMKIPGVTAVHVAKDIQEVTVESASLSDRTVIVEKLAGLGYPEAGHN